MKIIVAYDTKFGNTERVALTITQTLREVHTAILRKVTDISRSEVEESQLLVVGCPTHAWGISAATREFFKVLRGGNYREKWGAAFDTRFSSPLAGSAAPEIRKQLKQLGFTVLAPSLSVCVKGFKGPLEEGELEKAVQFARTLNAVIEARASPGEKK